MAFDDGKRTEVISCKISKSMALDVFRLSESKGRSPSNMLYEALKTKLYGEMVRLEEIAAQGSKVDKVDRDD